MVRYVRDEELIADALKQTRRGVRDVQRPTGTERAQTMDTAIQAAADSTFARELAEQLEGELGPLPGQIQAALGEAAAALEESGLARSEAATAVADASAAVADATQAIEDAGLAQAAADGAATAASDAQSVAGAAQLAADAAETAAVAAASAAAAAGSDATDALADAEAARLAAVAAQAKADDAFADAAAAAIAAGNAQASADGKNTVWYQDAAPTGAGHKVDDVWFDTAQGNRMARWTGSIWAAVEFGGAALANSAVTAIKLADDAVTAAKIATGAVDDDALSSAVKDAITTAQSTAENAASVAGNAQSAAAAAQGAATAAQGDADQAIADALAAANAAATADGKAVTAQGTANAKGKTIIQSTAPAAADRLAQNLWIDTTGGANTPKRWTTGTTWVAVTDKVATDAAAAAVTAKNTADAAQSTADTAQGIANAASTAAGAAQSAATAAASAAAAAQTTADGRAVVVRSTSAATAAGSYKLGDQWWQFSGGNVTGFWLHSGTDWVAQALTDAIIATLDAAKITTGFLAAARIEAATITGTHIAGTTITAANMVTGTITAASGIIANATIGTAQIIDLAVSGAKLANATITNAKIADATIESAKIANLDAAKITAGTLDAARIAALSIATGHLAANAVTAAKIAALTITAAEIASNAVTAVKIAANAVTAEKINAGAVTTDKLDALAVTAEKIAAGAIIADKIKANAITTAKLAVDAIDGMTITGATIRTAETGQRLQLDVNGLRAFNSAEQEVARIMTDGSGIAIGNQHQSPSNFHEVIMRRATPLSTPYTSVDGARLDAWHYFGTASVGATVEALRVTDPGPLFGETVAAFKLDVANGDTARFELSTQGGAKIIAPRLDVVVQNGLTANGRPVAFGMAAGTIPKQSVVSTASVAVAVTFPPGRFTQIPVVTPGKWADARDTNVGVDNITLTSCVVRLESNSTVTRTVGAQWTATQMLAGSASG